MLVRTLLAVVAHGMSELDAVRQSEGDHAKVFARRLSVFMELTSSADQMLQVVPAEEVEKVRTDLREKVLGAARGCQYGDDVHMPNVEGLSKDVHKA